MELAIQKRTEFSKVFMAYFAEKKLTKAQINSVDIPGTIVSIRKTQVETSLKVSGQLVLGLMRIFMKKCVFLISELEDALSAFTYFAQDTSFKENITASTQNITLSERKRKPISIEDTFSVSSYIQSTRESIEIGRNTVDVAQITLDEINYTPRSLPGSNHELPAANDFLQDINDTKEYNLEPMVLFEDIEPERISTPVLKSKNATPMTVKRIKRTVTTKHRTMNDQVTIKEIEKDIDRIRKEHLMVSYKGGPLDSVSLFYRPIMEIPKELNEVYINEIKQKEDFVLNEEQSKGENEAENAEEEQEVFVDPAIEINNFEGNEVEDIRVIEDERENCEDFLIKLGRVKRKQVKFAEIAGNGRKEVAKSFYELIVALGKDLVLVKQKEHFGDILIRNF